MSNLEDTNEAVIEPTHNAPPPTYISTPKSTNPWRAAVVSAVAALVVIGAAAIGFTVGHTTATPSAATKTPSGSNFFNLTPSPFPSTKSPHISRTEKTLAKKVDTGLVDITTNLGYQNSAEAGTGMILTKKGLVLTNNHVIAGATTINATVVSTGATYHAKVVGYDLYRDVALLQLKGARGLTPIKVATRVPLHAETVLGIGNAGGVGGTPSVAPGRVKALDQSITVQGGPTGSEQLSGLIESSPPISPGDSGGPLVNLKGKVLGMDTAASTGETVINGVLQPTKAYSIPISSALALVKDMREGITTDGVHLAPTAFLGVELAAQSSPSPFSFYFGTPPSTTQPASGATVQAVLASTPAAHTSLSAGDTITAINGSPVTSPAQLTRYMYTQLPGTRVTINYTTPSGVAASTSLTLGSGPPQ